MRCNPRRLYRKEFFPFSLLPFSFTHTLVCECARNVIEQVLEDVDYLRLCMMGLARIQMPMNMPPHYRAKEEHTYTNPRRSFKRIHSSDNYETSLNICINLCLLLMETILLRTLNSEYSSLGTKLKGLIAKRFKVDSHEILILLTYHS